MPLFRDEKFKNTFRVKKDTFNRIVQGLISLRRQDTTWRTAIPLEKRVAIALYALGSSAEYRTVASLFGVGRSTVGEIVLEVCKVINKVFKKQTLNAFPPTQEKINEIVNGFNALGFPQCYGAIDGCHIEVRPPKDEAVDYHNYKGWHSIVLFAAVDYRCRFTYVNIGAPGRCNDSMIFENSMLKIYLENNTLFKDNAKMFDNVPVPILLLGDSAFRISNCLLKPFPYVPNQSPSEKLFNYKLSKCRRVVENAFGHLKARFRKVGKGLEVNINNVCTIVLACCVLHNLCNESNDHINSIWLQEMEKRNNTRRNQPHNTTICGDSDQSRNISRNALLNYFTVCQDAENLNSEN